MLDLIKLKAFRKTTIDSIECLTDELSVLYEQYPGLFPKSPKDMSTADKLRFSGDLITFVEQIKTRTK